MTEAFVASLQVRRAATHSPDKVVSPKKDF
jgi:hypothetical protein